MMDLPPPMNVHRFSKVVLALGFISSATFIFSTPKAFATEYIFDSTNPWLSSESFESGSVNEKNTYKILSQGLDSSINVVRFVETTSGNDISVLNNVYEIVGPSENLNEFTSLQFKDSQRISVQSNVIKTGSGKYSQSLTGIKFVTSHEFPWDDPAEQCLNISIENNSMTVSAGTESKFVTMVSVTQVGGSVSQNTFEVNGGKFTEVKGIDANEIDDKKGELNIFDNEVRVKDSVLRGVYGVVTNGDWTGNISENKLYLSGENTLEDSYEGVFIHAQESAGSHTNRESLKTPLSGGLLDVQGILNVKKGSSFSMASSYSYYAPVQDSVIHLHDLEINIDKTMPINMFGGYSQSNSVTGNQIKIDRVKSTSSRKINIFAGYSDPDEKFAEATLVSNNHIEISDSILNAVNLIAAFNSWGACENASISISNGSIIGGIISPFKGQGKLDQQFSNGTITIVGENDLSNASLKPIDFYTENIENTTLIMDGFSGTINQLGYAAYGNKYVSFDAIIFKNQTWSNEGTLLNIDPYTVYGQAVSKSSFNENSLSFVNPQDIKPGQTITLVHYQAWGIEDEGHLIYTDDGVLPDEFELQATAGTSSILDGTIRFEDDDITYTIAGSEQAEQTVLVGDSRLAAAAFVNQGSDLLERVFHGFTLSREKYGLMTFATAEGTKSSYDLSTPIKINGWNFLSGLRYVAPTGYGDLTTALFVEYGDGNYRTTNSYLGLDFRTDGSLQYIGGGVAMRLMTPANFYAEGSIRAGELCSNLDRALMDANGKFYDADTTSLYAGIHLGAGYIFKPTADLELDSYARYFFTYTDSDSFHIEQYNENYEFESIASNRLRLGARLSSSQDNMTFMFGLACEYEFAGESDMIVANAATETSDLGGFSAFAEAGLSIKPNSSSPWQFDAQVRGWKGTREAVTGMVTVNYLF